MSSVQVSSHNPVSSAGDRLQRQATRADSLGSSRAGMRKASLEKIQAGTSTDADSS